MKMILTEPLPATVPDGLVREAVRSACSLIPPLFDLENFVAVNPFLGWSDTPLLEAAAKITSGLDAEVLPNMAHFRGLWHQGFLEKPDVTRAALRQGIHPSLVTSALSESSPVGEMSVPKWRLESERVLDQMGIDLPKAINRFVARNLADLFVSGDAPTPDRIFSELIARAAIDKTFELLGVHGWRKCMLEVPATAPEALEWAFEGQDWDPSDLQAYAYRILGSQYGWASRLVGVGWNSGLGSLDAVEALCVALIVFDQALGRLMPERGLPQELPSANVENPLVRFCLQEAYEDRLVQGQLSALPPIAPPDQDRPDFQLVFCIDVRSEPLRRKLEALSPRIETVGFAGFFGVAVDLVRDGQSSPRCPVLLKPQFPLPAKGEGGLQSVSAAVRSSFTSPGSFSLMEAIGLGYAAALLSNALGLLRRGAADERPEVSKALGLSLAERVNLAESLLTNSGIGRRLGRVVALCGHGGRSANNAHEASLDCGACGGHCGELNARLAVEVLNDLGVREELARRGYEGIQETTFLAGRHDTSTDEVWLEVPEGASAQIAELRNFLDAASAECRAERAALMGLDSASRGGLRAALEGRAKDWSEVRPEWGLARNSTFLAARRFRTRGVNLEGRAFLHDYDAAADGDSSVLKLILSAPMVVASWINLQYFASTVDNDRFGCGSKALLNRVSNMGVLSGNEGDLRPGLPIESVHGPDGGWFHDPVRLQVIVETPMDKLDGALGELPEVEALIRNGWVRLFALSPNGGDVWLKRMDGRWEPFPC